MSRRVGLKMKLVLVAAALVSSCSKAPGGGPPQPSTAAPSPSTAAPSPSTAAPSPSTVAQPPPAAASPIPAATTELILGIVDGWDATTATLSRWERTGAGEWRQVGGEWPAVTGSGLAWGRGLHGDGPPPGRSGERKAEGDGRSPAGVFALGGAYGYRATPPKGTRWPYTAVDKTWECVDDSASKAYGTIVNTEAVAPDWTSSEKMRRRDALYTWVVDVAHNPSHAANAGSCIFLHVWRAATSPTVGCTAMKQADLETLLAWLDPAAHPIYVLLPKAELAELTAGWGLPHAPRQRTP